jgi:hypothetical protein
MNPVKVIYDFNISAVSLGDVFNTIMFTPWFETAGIDFTVFNILFNPASFILVMGLVVAKKLVPLI